VELRVPERAHQVVTSSNTSRRFRGRLGSGRPVRAAPSHLGTYAILENKLGRAPGSMNTILAGGEPHETVSELHRSVPAAPTHGAPPQEDALRPTKPDALSQVSTEELLLKLRRRIIASRRHQTWDDGLGPHGEDWHQEGQQPVRR